MASQPDLFATPLPPGITLLAGLFDRACQEALVRGVEGVARAAPFRRPFTRGQGQFSAAITNCGRVGWWSDESGYRYTATQPGTDLAWPPFPAVLAEAVERAVKGTTHSGFRPDACLINFYQPTAKMGLHQDKDERDFSQPIVTISLGASADFLIGGEKRSDKPQIVRINSGDALIMAPPSRMRFHGVRKIHAGTSPIKMLDGRYSLTFRKAL